MAQINKPNQYFNTIIYTGDGTTKTITGVGFQPDFVWGKGRNSVSEHALIDSVRGATKKLNSDGTGAEVTNATSFLTGFTSDGYTVDSTSNFNVNTRTQVNWNWLASNTSGSSNTDGTITSTVSANTTSGFSIVSYTGDGNTNATVGHGLGVAPKMIITKNRSGANNWSVYHASLSTNNQITLNQTDGQNLPSPLMVTTVGSSTYTLGSGRAEINTSSNNYIAYCFAEKKGFSKFGSYTGNGSTDGTFVYTGFKPAFVVLKRSDSSPFDWFMHDNKRNGFNPDNDYLQANTSSSETNFDGLIDFTSNGFKIRTTSTAYNASGGTYIYMCFAENPLVGTNNIPATAR